MRNDQSRLLFCLAIRSNPRNAYKYSDGRMLTWRVYRDKRCRRSIYASGINATSLAAPPIPDQRQPSIKRLSKFIFETQIRVSEIDTINGPTYYR